MHPCKFFEVPALPDFEKYAKGILTGIFVLVGLVLNFFSLVILQKLKNRSQIHRYLQGLAIWDNVLLINGFFVHCLPVLLYGKIVLTGNFIYSYRYTYTLGNISLAGTVWMTVILAIDRYIAIVYPFNDFTRDQEQRSFKVFLLTAAVSLLTVILGLPYAFEIQTGFCLTENNTTLPAVGTSELRNNWYYQIVYRIIFGMILHSFVPMLLLIFLLLRISLEVYWAKQRRRKMSAQTMLSKKRVVLQNNGDSTVDPLRPRQQRKSPSTDNIMLLFVAVKFLLTRSLTVCINIAEIILGRQEFNSSQLLIRIIDLSNFLVILNSATNILVYMIVGRRFRSETVKTLRCRRRKSRESSETACLVGGGGGRTATYLSNASRSSFCVSYQRSPSLNQSPTLNIDLRRKNCQAELKVMLEDRKNFLHPDSYNSLLNVLINEDQKTQTRLSSY